MDVDEWMWGQGLPPGQYTLEGHATVAAVLSGAGQQARQWIREHQQQG